MENKFEVIDHTADIGIVAYGGNLNELFANAARGLFSLITDIDKIASKVSKKIELDDRDMESLLVAWLNDLLYTFEVESTIFGDFDVTVSEGNRLSANCYGEKVDPQRHHLRREIKAATYHNIHIAGASGMYSARVIFDI